MTTLNVYVHLIDRKNVLVDSYISESSQNLLNVFSIESEN